MDRAISHTGEYRSLEDTFVLLPLNRWGFSLEQLCVAREVFFIELERVMCVCVCVLR
jgi:hypothetical protein